MSPRRYLLPLVDSKEQLRIDWAALRTVTGHDSIVDTGVVRIDNRDQAYRYLEAYGFDLHNEDDARLLEELRQQSVDYVQEVLLPYKSFKTLPAAYLERGVVDLLLEASTDTSYPHWACILLKVLHCAVHARLTSNTEARELAFEKMQRRIGAHTHTTRDGTTWIGDSSCQIPLFELQFKKEKRFYRHMTKLLHKEGNLALLVTDHIGVRFITHTRYAAVLLINYLLDRHLFNGANMIPEHSKNSLADEAEARKWFDPIFDPAVVGGASDSESPTFNKATKEQRRNAHSASNFKMLKFVERVMVQSKSGRRTFFPFEVQVFDKDVWHAILEGEASHEAYKTRQLTTVRKRLFAEKQNE